MTPIEAAKAEARRRLVAKAEAIHAKKASPEGPVMLAAEGQAVAARPPRADEPTPGRAPTTLDQRIASRIGAITDVTGGIQSKAMEGMTAGLAGDEFRAGIGSAVGPKTYDQALSDERATEAKFAADHPVLSAGAELAGAVAAPMGAVRSVAGAALRAGGQGYVNAFMEGEGDTRMADAARGGATSALFGGTLAVAQKGISAGVARLFNKAAERPTVEGLRTAKAAAYNAVDNSGEVFRAPEISNLATSARQSIDAGYNFFPETDIGTAAALAMLDRTAKAGNPLTLSQLDKMRQGMWKLYSRTDEPGVLDVIGNIDDLIDNRAGASAVMGLAREANSRYRKTEMLEDAFAKARMQTESTGSGGNILNKYKQAVTAIATNPKKAKWFSTEEIAAMERFVEGDLPENILRRIGKLAPGGNGLMLALNLVAGSVNPGFLAATAAAQAAKSTADRSGIRGAEALQELVATGRARPVPTRDYGPASRLGGAAGAKTVRRD